MRNSNGKQLTIEFDYIQASSFR